MKFKWVYLNSKWYMGIPEIVCQEYRYTQMKFKWVYLSKWVGCYTQNVTKGCYINMLRVRGPKQKIEPHETECVGHMYAISAEITVFLFYSFSKHRFAVCGQI